MKQFIIALFIALALAAPALATDVQIAPHQSVAGFNVAGLAAEATYSVTVTNGSATVAPNVPLRADLWGKGGFYITINGTGYYISSVNGGGTSITLTANYAGSTSASASLKFFRYVEARIFSDKSFYPAGSNNQVFGGVETQPFLRYACSIVNEGGVERLYMPAMTLPATTSLGNTPTNLAKYTMRFYVPSVSATQAGTLLYTYGCSGTIAFRVPEATPTNWRDICAYNTLPQVQNPNQAVTLGELYALFPTCSANSLAGYIATGRAQSCVTVGARLTLNGGVLSADIQTVPPQFQNRGSNLPILSNVNIGGTTIDPDGNSDGLKAYVNVEANRIEIATTGIPTRYWNFITDYNASPSITLTTGNINSGSASLTIASATEWRIGQGILVAGAGIAGADLIATVTAITGNTFTLSTTASVTVAGARVQHDNSDALQTAANAHGAVFVPHGDYLVARSVTLPTNITEGYPFILTGSGPGNAKLFYQGTGSLFVGQASASIQNMIVRDLTIASTEPGAPTTTNHANSKGWAFDLSESTVVNNLQLHNLQFGGWGRGAITCANCQNGILEKLTIRQSNTCAICLTGPETVFVAGGENNVTAIKDVQIELMQYVNDSDVILSDVSWTSGSKTITVSGIPFSSLSLGRYVRVANAGQTGGDVIAIIKQVLSASSVVLSAANNSGATITGGSGTMLKTNIASVWLHRASQGAHGNVTTQGNWSNAPDGHVTHEWIVENSNGVNIQTPWVEPTGGNGGSDFKLINTNNVTISGYHSNADPSLWPASHSNFLTLVNAKSTYVTGADLVSSSDPFSVDANSQLFVDNSYLGYPVSRLQPGYFNVVYGENVHFRIAGAVDVGNASQFDATYGENFVTNPRYDALAGAASGWTQNIGTALTYTNAGSGRAQRYVTVNRQSDSASLSVSQTLTQTIAVPDDVPAGPWVLAFDWRLEDHGTPRASTSATGGQVYVDVQASGTGSVGYPVAPATGFRWFNFTGDGNPEDAWYRSSFRLFLGTGTSRSFTVRIFSSAGPQTPAVSFTNWRLLPGKHAPASYDQPITQYKGGVIEQASTLVLKDLAGGGTQSLAVNNSGQVVVGSGGGGGAGIATINPGGNTGPAVELATDKNGTDFGVSGGGNIVTISCPDASTTKRGCLKKEDFAMFNAKIGGSIALSQIAVGSGTGTVSGSFDLVGGGGSVISTAAVNGVSGFNQYNSSNSALAQAVFTASNNLVVNGTLGVNSSSFSNSGLFKANQVFIDAAAGAVELLFNLNDSGVGRKFRWGIGAAQVANLDETGLVLGATTTPSTRLDISSAGLSAGFLGIRARNVNSSTTPDASITTGYVGVDASGYLKIIATPTVIAGTNGQLPIGNGSGYTMATLTATANETKVTNGAGSITVGIADAFDLSGKTSTAPVKAVLTASTPSSCTANKELLIKTDATAGQQLFICNSTGNGYNLVGDGGGGGGSTVLSAVTAATGGNSINNGDHAQVWNSQLTTSGKTFFKFGESAAGTAAGTPHNVSIETLSTSTVNPLQVIVNANTTPAGIRVNASGQLVAVGTGGVNGAAIVGANTVPNSVLDPDVGALGASSCTGAWVITGAGTGICRSLAAGSSSLVWTNASGVAGNPTVDTAQNITTAGTPQFAGGGFGVAAPSAGLNVIGKTINTDATNTVAAETVTNTYTKNDSNTRVFSTTQIKPTFNFGGSNANTTVNVFEIDSTNTNTTGATINLLKVASGGASVFNVASNGNAVLTGSLSVASCTGCGSVAATFSTGNYSALTPDSTIINTPSGANSTVTYLAASAATNKEVRTCKGDTSTYTVSVSAGGSTYPIYTPFTCVTLVSNGTTWNQIYY